jgi:hypothetical protein
MSKRYELVLILIATIVLGFAPSVVVFLTGSIPLAAMAVAVWLLSASVFCWRARRLEAFLVFLLLPLVLYFPFIVIMIVRTGAF